METTANISFSFFFMSLIQGNRNKYSCQNIFRLGGKSLGKNLHAATQELVVGFRVAHSHGPPHR